LISFGFRRRSLGLIVAAGLADAHIDDVRRKGALVVDFAGKNLKLDVSLARRASLAAKFRSPVPARYMQNRPILEVGACSFPTLPALKPAHQPAAVLKLDAILVTLVPCAPAWIGALAGSRKD